MAFLDQADGPRQIQLADNIRAAIALEEQAKQRGEVTKHPLSEVVVRYRRMTVVYEERPLILPTTDLAWVHELAAAYRRDKKHLHIDTPGVHGYNRRAFIEMDELVVIEVLDKPHVPEQNDEDIRRAPLHGSRRTTQEIDL